MASSERLLDGTDRTTRHTLARVGSENRQARTGSRLTLRTVSAAAGISSAELSRIELALAPRVPLAVLIRICAVVGLDLVVNAYPARDPLRDAAQVALITRFARRLHPSLRWAIEVPLPTTGDRRSWDGLVGGPGWRYGVEAETLPNDAQALIRKLHLKERDGEVDGVLLVLPDSRRARAFVRAARPLLGAAFPVPGRRALAQLVEGRDPGGSATIILPIDRPEPVASVSSRPT